MAEEKVRYNIRVHLSGNKYILGDGLCYFIAREDNVTTKTGKNKGEITTRRTRLSGYHSDFSSLMDSYFKEQIKSSEIDGELADLAKLVAKTRKEIRGWWGKLDKAMEGEADD